MSMVTLVSGGLDSTLMSILAKEEGITLFPLFIDYGQLCIEREWEACIYVHKQFGLPSPIRMDLAGYGKTIPSGLTSKSLRVNEDAFLPGRNLLFLLAACSYAYSKNANAVAIGLLSEETHIFPDQTKDFVEKAQSTINVALERDIRIITPLMNLNKHDVLAMAKKKGIEGTYSCHSGTLPTCGSCIACRQYID
ncbi:7-cyano-7-deazaguanine synthase [Dehalococcoides sp. UCH007]|uniref:7-cyano-7-deazaguanine synthase n=1 Tax=Dehalococcoides sp. UCH007 TaxID=1522671 RepID=UPI0005B57525|nr:7-cyano-7-deazaguanine synthase [Dehalococcoides sp. UCH007]OPX92547.1 MAG: 7-cyano-7-deazaguanine synthase [Pelotomaculum sp. PtaB.Bin104]BAQ34152.1 7-cyano-7-deazaguanine synthase [Dehalococcoides sp. UCH007]